MVVLRKASASSGCFWRIWTKMPGPGNISKSQIIRAKEKIIMYTPSSKKVLATAVLCSLLAASPVWATQQATDTVTGETNVSTAADPYSKIEVKTTDREAIGINANVRSDGSSNM